MGSISSKNVENAFLLKIMTSLLDVDYKDLKTEFTTIKNALNQKVLKQTQEETKKIGSLENKILNESQVE